MPLGLLATAVRGLASTVVGMFTGPKNAIKAVARGVVGLGRSGGASRAVAVGTGAATGAGKQPATLLDKLWTLESLGRIKDRILDGYSPEFQHTIFVAVKGGPKADINRIWRLALATAFGKYRNAIKTYQGAQLEASWDITEKIVGVKISYAVSGALANLVIGQGSGGLEYLYRGPSQETVGGTWPGWLRTPGNLIQNNIAAATLLKVVGGLVIPGGVSGPLGNSIGAGINNLAANSLTPPLLEDNGRLITTANKYDPNVQPPRPDSDYFVALVSNMLTNPCYAPAAPPPNGNEDNIVRVPKRFFPNTNTPPTQVVNEAVALYSNNDLAFTAVAGGAAAAALAIENNQVKPASIDGYPAPIVVPPLNAIASVYNNAK